MLKVCRFNPIAGEGEGDGAGGIFTSHIRIFVEAQ